MGLSGEEAVERMPVPFRGEGHHVVGDADRRAGSFLPDRGGRLGVGGEEMVQGPAGGPRVGEAGRDLAVEKAAEEEDERLVQDRPEPHVRGEGPGDLTSEARESRH